MAERPLPVLGSIRRIARLTRIELVKLLLGWLFPVAVVAAALSTAGLALVAKILTETSDSSVRFSNYSLWIASVSVGLRVGVVLLVALGATALSSEATWRTLNTVLARPVRRFEFLAAKVLTLLVATVAVVGASGLAGYLVGGTVPPREAFGVVRVDDAGKVKPPPVGFPSYGDVVDPHFPDTVIATRGEVMGSILYGFLLALAPVFAAASVGLVLGTLLSSSGLAIGLSVGLFVALEGSKFFAAIEENIGRYSFNYPLNRIFTNMMEAGQGAVPVWDEALRGVAVAGAYVVASIVVALVVFCRRDITL